MSGEILEASASEASAAAVSEVNSPTGERGHGGVAILLTAAAVFAAIIGFHAATVSSSASESWQSALRTEVKRSAAAMEDVRYLYQTELPVAVRVVQARVVQAEMLAAAQGQSGAARQTLLLEANVQGQIISALSSSSKLAAAPEYALQSGGLDLARRLADLRAQYPQILALDPDKLETTGDQLAHKAELTMLALIPTSIAAFLGVFAQPFRRRRTLLLRLGGLALGAGVIMVLVVEAVA